MSKLSIAFIAILTICESLGTPHGYRPKQKRDRMGYGYEPMSAYESYGGGYGGGHDMYGGDLLSEYSSDYGLDSYDSHGSYGGGYEMEGYGGGGYGGGGYGGYAMPSKSYSMPKKMGYGGGGYGGGKMAYMPAPKYSDYGKEYMPKITYKKSYEMKGMYGKGGGKQYNVKVPYDDSPVKVMFLTQNTPVHIQQKHKKGKAEYRKATTHEEPHVVVHEVIKPVIQEIREIIVPFRKVIQKIEPVKEERKTIVHKKDGEEDDGDDDKKYRKYKKDDDDDDDKKYRKYKKDDDDDDDDKYKSYKKYGRDDDDDDDDKKYGRRDRDRDDDKKYGSRMGDSSSRMGDSSRMASLASLQQSANSQLQTLANGGTLNNGMTLASIFGQQMSEEKAKSS